jgi:hypothetical protein
MRGVSSGTRLAGLRAAPDGPTERNSLREKSRLPEKIHPAVGSERIQDRRPGEVFQYYFFFAGAAFLAAGFLAAAAAGFLAGAAFFAGAALAAAAGFLAAGFAVFAMSCPPQNG